MSEVTPLPEPAMKLHGKRGKQISAEAMELYTEAQLKFYGAAEYQRAIEDAAKVCQSLNTQSARDLEKMIHALGVNK